MFTIAAVCYMKINEIFYSIQGEGLWTGMPNVFIRTTGCNLRCSYCDTKYAYAEGKDHSIDSVFKAIKIFKCKQVCITGGEPTLQPDIYELTDVLLENEYLICMETNGSMDISKIIQKNVLLSLDIKCPSSGMSDKMLFKNLDLLRESDQLKFVIKDHNDFLYSKNILEKYLPVCTVFFQPVWGTNFEVLAKWILKNNLKVKLGLQIHKVIWGDKLTV